MSVRVIGGGGVLLLLGVILWLGSPMSLRDILEPDKLVERNGSSFSAPQPPAKPNVLLITVDTLRADALGIYGHPRNRTPNIDSLARQGATFLMALAPVPQTNPSHASIFTGMFPKRHGLFHHMGSLLSDSVKPLAEILAEVGYTTAGHYSWISFDPEFSGLERGFATYQRHTIDRPWPGDRRPDWYEDYMDGRADVTTEAVLPWLDGVASEPFFLWVHYMDPHFPFAPPPPFDSMYTTCQGCPNGSMETIKQIAEGRILTPGQIAHLRALYDGEVSFSDEQVGRLLGRLKDRGLLDRTVVVFMADHGESFGENGLWFHPAVLYDTGIRIPLIIRYPPQVPAVGVKTPVQAVDVLPTILNILGMAPPDDVEGKSLLPLMLGKESGQDRSAFSQLWDGRKVAIVYQGRKLLKDMATGELEMYDLAQDPGELHNLAVAQPDIARQMEARLDRWASNQGIGP